MKFSTLWKAALASVSIGLLLAVVTVTYAAPPATQPPQVKADINADGVAAIIRSRVSVSVLDARGSLPERLPGAKPLAPNASASAVARLLPNKKHPVLPLMEDFTATPTAVPSDPPALILNTE